MIKRKYLYYTTAILIILLIGVYYVKYTQVKNEKSTTVKNQSLENTNFNVDKNGYLSYPLDREKVKFSRETINQTGNLLVSKIIYQSGNGNIYGLLVIPTSSPELLPGVVLLPGAGVSKESELGLAMKIAELDYAVLVIDQRGVGETSGFFPNLDEDYSGFLKGQEPYQYLMVYDALRGFDLLKSAPFVDPEKIVMVGESLGGRVAIIATAIDRNVKGVVGISTAGFGFTSGNDTSKNMFIKSIDSDHYISTITPRKLVMIHNLYDKNIPVSSAVKSFSKADEPKKFVLVNDTSCNHGYCDSMHQGLVESLDFVTGIRHANMDEGFNSSIAINASI